MHFLHQSYLHKAIDIINISHVKAQIKTSYAVFGNEVNKTINASTNIGQPV